MKTRGAKVLLSLLAIAAVGFATANAYTFEVVNRSPFGILNLSQLVIKPTTSTTSMTLSEYLLQIYGTQGQINVHQICDENGSNCIDIKDIGSGGGGNGVQILTGNEGYICTQSGDNLVCNTTGNTSLDLSDFMTGIDEKLCRKSGNKLVCNGRFGNGHINFYNGTNNEVTVRKDSENLGNGVPLDGAGIYNVYIPVPVISGTNQYICVKSGEDTICGTAKLGSMNPGKYCYFTGDSITCTEDGPGNGTITLQTLSGDNETVTRSSEFTVNTSTDMTITIPGGEGGGLPGPKGDTGAYIVNAAIEGQNIVFTLNNGDNIIVENILSAIKGATGDAGAYITAASYDSETEIITFTLSNGNTIAVPDIFSSIVGPQGDTGATGLGIHHIDTDKVDRVTTVTIIGTDESTLASFEVLDGIDGDGTGINATGQLGQRCTWQCNGNSFNVSWICGGGDGMVFTNQTCEDLKNEYHDMGCNDEYESNTICKDYIKGVQNDYEYPVRLTYTQNNDGGDCGIQCNESAPSCQGQCEGSGDIIYNGIQVTHYSEGKTCRYLTQGYINMILANIGENEPPRGNPERTSVGGSGEIRCVFNDGGIHYDNYDIWSGIVNIFSGIRITIHSGNTINIYSGANITIYSGNGDGNWAIAQESIYYNGSQQTTNVLEPTSDEPLYFYSDFYHSGAFNFYTYNSTSQAGPSTRITFDQKGLRVGNGATYSNAAGASIGGMLTIGIGKNSITSTPSRPNPKATLIKIYATGDIEDPSRHYEIMGTHELAVGTDSGAFVYFTYITGNLANDIYRYRSYSVGINTQQPKATLDVNGSVKIGNNCVPATCDENSVGTIMYYEKNNIGYYVACKRNSNTQFGWYDLLNGSTIATGDYSVGIPNYNVACGYVSPKPADIGTGEYYGHIPAVD